jgi:hypothetical protein
MAVLRVQVNYKQSTAAKWSNVWHVSGTDLALAASTFSSTAIPHLRNLLHVVCFIDSLLVSSPDDDTFVTLPVGLVGTSDHEEGLLPLFDAMKAFLLDGSLGRPDYKFFKGYLTEGTTEAGEINTDIISFAEGELNELIADMADTDFPLVSADNDQYSNGVVQRAIQMRQMHRRRRRVVVTP